MLACCADGWFAVCLQLMGASLCVATYSIESFSTLRLSKLALTQLCTALLRFSLLRNMASPLLKLLMGADDAVTVAEPRAMGFYDNMLTLLKDTGCAPVYLTCCACYALACAGRYHHDIPVCTDFEKET